MKGLKAKSYLSLVKTAVASFIPLKVPPSFFKIPFLIIRLESGLGLNLILFKNILMTSSSAF